MNGPTIETIDTSPATPPQRPWVAIGVSLTVHAALIATAISVPPSSELRHTSVRPGAATIELQASRPPTTAPTSTRFETEPDTPPRRTAPGDTDESLAADDAPPEPESEPVSNPRDRRRRPDTQVSATTRATPPPIPSQRRPSASEPQRVRGTTSSDPLPEVRQPSLRPETRPKPTRPLRPEPATTASVPVPATSTPVPATSTPGAPQQTPRPLASNRPPNYPAEAIADRVEGTTTLRATVGAEGQVTRLEINRSSGSAVLDQAAMSAVALWRFEPERQSVLDRGPRRVLIPIRFRLGD